MNYLAQYEVLDQDQTLATLTPEATQRFTEDVLQLGFVLGGPISEPRIVQLDGEPWIEIEAKVRSAAKLLNPTGGHR